MACEICGGEVRGGMWDHPDGVACDACGVLAVRLVKRDRLLSWSCSIPDRVWDALAQVHPGPGRVAS